MRKLRLDFGHVCFQILTDDCWQD